MKTFRWTVPQPIHAVAAAGRGALFVATMARAVAVVGASFATLCLLPLGFFLAMPVDPNPAHNEGRGLAIVISGAGVAVGLAIYGLAKLIQRIAMRGPSPGTASLPSN